MNRNLGLKILGQVGGLALLLTLWATPAWAAEAEQVSVAAITPKVAFSINSSDLLLFQSASEASEVVSSEPATSEVATSATAAPATIVKNKVPVISVEDTTYIPIREFCLAFDYRLVHNSENGTITISNRGKSLELAHIRYPADLDQENTYFSLKGVSYTKVKNFAKLENLQTVKQDNVLFLYSPPLPAPATQPLNSPVNPPATEAIFSQQDDSIILTESFVRKMQENVSEPAEDYALTIKNAYSSSYTTPFINPYVAYTYPQMRLDIARLEQQYPEYITTSSAGKSVEGRDLVTIELGNGSKHIYILGSHHAREYISTTYIMYFINQAAYAAKTGTTFDNFDVGQILEDVTYHIIPMVNPDGVNLVQNGIASVSPEFRAQVKALPILKGGSDNYRSWKSNINGVDLNRNYPTNWNASKSKYRYASEMSPGSAPASEPEVQAVMKYLKKYPAPVVVSMHSQGEWIYWSNPTGEFGEMGQKMVAASGFKPEKNSLRESKGGYLSNYVREVLKKYEITIELCQYIGPRPYPDAQFDEVWLPAKDLLFIVGNEVAKDY